MGRMYVWSYKEIINKKIIILGITRLTSISCEICIVFIKLNSLKLLECHGVAVSGFTNREPLTPTTLRKKARLLQCYKIPFIEQAPSRKFEFNFSTSIVCGCNKFIHQCCNSLLPQGATLLPSLYISLCKCGLFLNVAS